ncbi:MAG: FliM/FliN family flagellar motor C-terminal domain-containing protein [Henriciella sp.]|jgi:flagellar motor switch protein FliN/FliY
MTEPQTERDEMVEFERRKDSPQNMQPRAVYSLPVDVIISLGQKRLSVAEVLKLQVDTIVPLQERIDDPLQIIVDNKVLAHCELIEIDEGQLAVKITKILDATDA